MSPILNGRRRGYTLNSESIFSAFRFTFNQHCYFVASCLNIIALPVISQPSIFYFCFCFSFSFYSHFKSKYSWRPILMKNRPKKVCNVVCSSNENYRALLKTVQNHTKIIKHIDFMQKNNDNIEIILYPENTINL